MKKIYLVVLAVFALSPAFAQTKKAQPAKPADCYKTAEFNKKINSVKQADKLISGEIIHVRGQRPVYRWEFENVQGVKDADIYAQLVPTDTTGKTNRALPADRLYMEFMYVKGGSVKYMSENLNFCEFKSTVKPTKPTLKLDDKLADGKNCFKVSDFKSKLQGLPQNDSVKVIYTLINSAGEKATIRVTSMKDLKQFNLYNWLSKGAETGDTNFESGSASAETGATKIKAQPGDLVIINITYPSVNRSYYETNQFPICKP